MNAKVFVFFLALLAVQGAKAQSVNANISITASVRIFSSILGIIEQVINGTKEIVQVKLDGLATITKTNLNFIQQALNDTLAKLKPLIDLIKTIPGRINCLPNVVSAVQNLFIHILDALSQFTEDRKKDLLSLADIVFQIVQEPINILRQLPNLSIRGIISAIFEKVIPLIRKFSGQIPIIITRIIGDIVKAVVKILRKFIGIILSIIGCLPRPF